jgi:hypothetical protein
MTGLIYLSESLGVYLLRLLIEHLALLFVSFGAGSIVVAEITAPAAGILGVVGLPQQLLLHCQSQVL